MQIDLAIVLMNSLIVGVILSALIAIDSSLNTPPKLVNGSVSLMTVLCVLVLLFAAIAMGPIAVAGGLAFSAVARMAHDKVFQPS